MKREISYGEIEKDLAELNKALKTVKKNATVEKALNNLIEDVKSQTNELQKHEEELKNEKAFSEFIIESSQLPIVVTDKDWKWIRVNRAFEEMFGFSAQEVIGKSNYELPIWEPEEYKKLSERVRSYLEKEGMDKYIDLETRCKTKDGKNLDMVLREVFVSGEVSKEIGFVGYLMDITELRKREKELKHAISNFGSVLSAASAGDLTAKVDLSSVSKEYKQIGKDINKMISVTEKNITELRKREEELNQTVSICSKILDKVAQKGDLNARIDVSKLAGKHKTIGVDINLIIDFLQNKIEEVCKREAELAKAKMREETIVNSALDLIILLDNENRWLMVNPAWEEVTGFKPEELQGKITEEQPCVTPEALKALVPDRKKLAKGEIVPPFDLPFRHKDGRKIIVWGTERPLKDVKGKWIGSVWTGRDITELRKREEESKEINAVNEFTYSNMPDSYQLTDKEWRLIKVNKAFEKITGYKQEEVIGKTSYEFPAEYKCGRNALWGDEDELKRMEEICEKTPLGGTIHEITRWRTKFGEPRIIDLTEIYLPEEISTNIGFVTIGKDITEERKREEELKNAKLYAEAIIANISDPLWVTDIEGDWILVNDAMERATKYEKRELLEKQTLTHPLFSSFISMLDGKEKLRDMLENVRVGKHVLPASIPWLTKDGRMLIMSCSGEPLRDAEGNVIGGVFIGKDMSTLQRAGIVATKTLYKAVESKVGKDYGLVSQMFMSNTALIVGDSSLEILRGTVEGYNRRFNKNIGIKEGIALTNMPREEWPSFIEFLLSRFYECIGPTSFECCEGIKSIGDIVEKVKAKYEG